VATILAIAAAAGAQDGKMGKMKAKDAMRTETNYTGCIERSPDGVYTLAHAMAADAAMKKPMAKDSMAKDSMATDSMMKDAMAPALGLSSTSVDLAKHVGHKVTVKGTSGDTMGGMATFTVTSVKMVAASCS
jgi:hypothetical protein